jgi:hypothetical protein
MPTGAVYDVKTSVVEIYCEKIRDLLDPGQENLQVKQDSAGSIFIEGEQRRMPCASLMPGDARTFAPTLCDGGA